MCNLEELFIGISDFDCIADVANSCDIDRLCPHIREAQETHLANKIGWGLMDAISANLTDLAYQDLLCGSSFEYCGKKYKHFGLKRVLVYYSYGIYKYLGNYTDVNYGTVYKSVQDSVPVDDKILTKIRDQNFNLANEYWQNVERYLCANKDTFPDFDTCDCKCECSTCGTKTTQGQSRLRKTKTFRKYGNDNYTNKKQQSIHYDGGCDNC